VAAASGLGTRPVLSTREVASVEYTTHLVSSPGFFGTPLVIEPSSDQLFGDAGVV
jgi:hypothetical protein